MQNEGAVGSVMAYNFLVDDYYVTPTDILWQQSSSYDHNVGDQFLLYEGNEGVGAIGEDLHGTADFTTYFRNYWHGRDPNGGSNGGKTEDTNRIQIQAYSRFYNIVGNVLGTATYHNNYDVKPSSQLDTGNAHSDTSIYSFAYSGVRGTRDNTGNNLNNDMVAYGTHLRWGNYDTVNGQPQWNSSEVPTGRTLARISHQD